MPDAPQGEQILNCLFCHEDPRAEGHYQVGKLLLERPEGVVVQHTLTCLHAWPKDRPELFWSYTFNLNERLVAEPRVAVQDRWFFEDLGKRLEGEQ